MKRLLCLWMALGLLLSGCGAVNQNTEHTILATAYPVYYLTERLTEGMEVETVLMVSDAVSCLHDYTITTAQMKKLEQAELIVMSGSGLEDFMSQALESVSDTPVIVAGDGYEDPHYWLSPACYLLAAETVCEGLIARYPESEALLLENLDMLREEIYTLQEEISDMLSALNCRELITFHDGFFWFADAFDLTIAAAIEEEEGAEASAAELREICELVESRSLPAVFVERNGSTNAADIISRETGVAVYELDMIIDGETDYFAAMENNALAVLEALS